MSEISPLRLHVLRAMYLLIVVGLGATVWPHILAPSSPKADAYTVINSILGAFSLLALLGLRYPLKMLPILIFELIWKTLWVGLYATRMWRSGGLDAYASEVFFACAMGVVLTPIAIPWRYVINHYIKAEGEPWLSRKRSPSTSP